MATSPPPPPPSTIPLSHDSSPHSYIDYNATLPYLSSDAITAEHQILLADIKSGLAAAVLAQDIAPGVVYWIKQLNTFLDLKYPLPTQDRRDFAELLYKLALSPGLDHALLEVFVTTCCHLIKKRTLLTSKELTLPWRPLYEAVRYSFFPKSRDRLLPGSAKHLESLMKLIVFARRFFHTEAAYEVMEELIPYFYPHTLGTALVSQSLLIMFLPTECVPTIPASATSFTLPPDTPTFYWLPTIFSVWKTMAHVSLWDSQFLDLLGRLTESQVHCPQLTVYTRSDIQYVFSVALRLLDLPVGSGNATSIKPSGAKSSGEIMDLVQRYRKDRFEAFAKFVVNTIFPESSAPSTNGEFSLTQLSNLLQAIESFYHPSNSGRWSIHLSNMIRYLSQEFLRRLRREAKLGDQIPQHLKLTDEIKTQFVDMLKPVAYLSMFGKDPYTVMNAQLTLKNLCYLAPELVVPGLLERIYPSLTTLTETHRTMSSIGTLSQVITPMLTKYYPQGPQHLLPLLNTCLPGIDINDPNKTFSTLVFFANTFMVVPIWDVMGMSERDNMSIQDTDDENTLVLSMTEFGNWVVAFLERVFALFENLPEEHANMANDSTMETNLIEVVLNTCEILFTQSSPEILKIASNRLFNFVKSTVLPNASKYVAFLVASITSNNPEALVSSFFPLCIERIREEISYGAGSKVGESVSIPSDGTLHWYMNIAYHLMMQTGTASLKYRVEILELLKLCMEKLRSKMGVKLLGKMIKNVLKSLTTIYPLETRSICPRQWNDKKFMAQHYKHWSDRADIHNLEIQWHIPSEEEISFALEIIDLVTKPSLERLKELMKTDTNGNTNANASKDVAQEFWRLLKVLKASVSGMVTLGLEVELNVNAAKDVFSEEDTLDDKMDLDSDIVREADVVGDDGDDDDDMDDDGSGLNLAGGMTALRSKRFLATGHLCLDASDPRTSTMRALKLDIAQLLHQLMTHFTTYRSTEVEGMKVMIKAIRIFMTNRGIERSDYDSIARGYKFSKSMMKTVEDKRYPRHMLVRRAWIHHELRMKMNSGHIRCLPVHKDLISDLIQYSFYHFTEIRKISQSVLTKVARCFSVTKYQVIPTILDTLQRFQEGKEKDPDRMKGALFLLSSKTFLNVVLRDWKFISPFLKTMALAQHEEKPSVQEVIRKVYIEYFLAYVEVSLGFRVPEHLAEIALRIGEGNVRATDVSVVKRAEMVQKKVSRNREIYHETVNALVEFVQSGKLHWRYATMTINFLELLLRGDEPIPQKLTEAISEGLVNDIPAIRRMCCSFITRILLLIKKRGLGMTSADSLRRDATPSSFQHRVGGLKTVAKTAEQGLELSKKLMDSSLQLNSESAWSDATYLDDPYYGWYCWPTTYPVYKANTLPATEELPYEDAGSQGALHHLETMFCTSEFWTKFSKFMSLENSNRANAEDFSQSTARFYKSIFLMFEDRFLELVKPIIVDLAKDIDQRSHQRAAAELFAGLIRGSKNWHVDKLKALWGWAVPVLSNIFDTVTPESILYWAAFLKFVLNRRDPRRMEPLLSLILNTQLDINNQSFFEEARKQYFIREVLNSMSWRIRPLATNLLDTYITNIRHPYKQVRDVIGDNLNEICQLQWVPGYQNLGEVLVANAITKGAGLVKHINEDDVSRKLVQVLNDLDKWREEGKARKTNIGSTDYANASKTLLSWCFNTLNGCRLYAVFAYVRPLFVHILSMAEFDDQDLQIATGPIISLFAYIPNSQETISGTLSELLNMIIDSTKWTWHTKTKVLPVLQVFYFRHLFMLNEEQMKSVTKTVGDLLLDKSQEVRQLASVTLSGLVRCSRRDAIEELKGQFSRLLAKKLPPNPRRNRSNSTSSASSASIASPTSPTSPTNASEQEFHDAVKLRHAGVLGLSCLVQAFPYEVPEWMPSVLVQLASCISDPTPIQPTVKKTFSEFRRTHIDNWTETSQAFTEDERYMLSELLVGPSYYA